VGASPPRPFFGLVDRCPSTAATVTVLHTVRIHVSTSIRVSDETKAKLSRLKRDEETWDEFLSRLANDEDPINVGAWSDEEAERARDAVEESRESFGR
jgi:predicted CopG family antitoxin